MKKILLLGVALTMYINTHAQLAVFNYATEPTDYNPTSKDGNVSTSLFSVSSGNVNFQTSPIAMYTSTWSKEADFSTSGKYYEFSITANSGYKMTLTSFSFDAGRTATGPAKIE